MNEAQRQAYLSAMGIQTWEQRPAAGAPLPPASTLLPDPAREASPAQPPEQLDWDALRQTVSVCTACGLHRSRTQTVFGVGNSSADLMLIGEAPGADEDRQGEPFVGRAGKLLNEMLRAIGFARQQVYIANILKCRPPNNRDPESAEVQQCEAYLRRQVELVSPKLILALGRVAAHNLLKTQVSLARLRGDVHYYGLSRVPLLVTYHPAYLLRSPQDKAKAWQDLCTALALLGGAQ